MTVRKQVELTGSGRHFVEVAGSEVLVEQTPDNTPQGVPVIELDTPGNPQFPAYNQSRYRPPRPFQRLYVDDQGGTTGTLYLTIITDERLQFRISSAVSS